MRTHYKPIRLFPSCLRTWPIRYKSRVDFFALTRTENPGLPKPQTCYAYPSLHDTWREGSRRWHMTKHLRLYKDARDPDGTATKLAGQSSKRKAVSKRHLPKWGTLVRQIVGVRLALDCTCQLYGVKAILRPACVGTLMESESLVGEAHEAQLWQPKLDL
ncbi:hypothetical protein SADUNF_Sadunf09G0018900 [Salix dunnii]|uniref:Uncharacterized protein n=1 Tax=Salix dunnii TaxID=1413687 RepID=A0A835JSL0_9ROSI|nr:hypothetical protein SADUNF_Sadunf09G0018900 [Salix dunnii]